MTDTQADRRNPNQYQCKHEAEIGSLRAGYDAIAKSMDTMVAKFDIVAGQMGKVVLMEERNEANMRELSRIAANVENLKDKFDDKFKHLEGHIEDRVVRIDERLSDKIDTVSDKLHQRINVLAGEHDKTDRLVHKWIYWGGGAWAAFCLIAWLVGGAPIDSLQKTWNKVESKIMNQEMVINGIDRRLERLESKK